MTRSLFDRAAAPQTHLRTTTLSRCAEAQASTERSGSASRDGRAALNDFERRDQARPLTDACIFVGALVVVVFFVWVAWSVVQRLGAGL